MAGPTALTLSTLSKAQKKKLQALSAPHEVTATIGVLNVMITTAIAVRFPSHYWIWHMIRTFIHLPLRYVRFKKQKWELFMLDWCYIVTYVSNACTVLAFLRYSFGIETFLADKNTILIRSGFAMAAGPLAWSISIFRNSLVFHDPDNTASVFIHLSPFVLFWCLRWGAGFGPGFVWRAFPGMFQVCGEADDDYVASDACLDSLQGWIWCDSCTAPLASFALYPVLIYFVIWWLPYLLIVLIACGDWVKRTKRETLYAYVAEIQPEMIAKFEKHLQGPFGKYAGPVGYMMLHMVTTLVFGTFSYVFWHSFLLHTIFFLYLLVTAVHNGSTYMFRIFAHRYVDQQIQKHGSLLE